MAALDPAGSQNCARRGVPGGLGREVVRVSPSLSGLFLGFLVGYGFLGEQDHLQVALFCE